MKCHTEPGRAKSDGTWTGGNSALQKDRAHFQTLRNIQQFLEHTAAELSSIILPNPHSTKGLT